MQLLKNLDIYIKLNLKMGFLNMQTFPHFLLSFTKISAHLILKLSTVLIRACENTLFTAQGVTFSAEGASAGGSFPRNLNPLSDYRSAQC